MIVSVHLFARARDLAGCSVVAVELPAGATVGELRRRLAVAVPALGSLLKRSSLAVAGEFAGDEQVIADGGVEIALLPPVSGG